MCVQFASAEALNMLAWSAQRSALFSASAGTASNAESDTDYMVVRADTCVGYCCSNCDLAGINQQQ